MATIKDIELKNTKAFLSNFTDKMVDLTKIEIGRKRKRVYENRTTYDPINASGKGRDSIAKVEHKDGFYIEGNDYLEDVDEGTSSTITDEETILKWIKVKGIRIRDKRGRFLTMTEYRKRNMARLIVEKLRDYGIRRTAFLTDLIRDKSLEKLKGIEEETAEDVVDTIENILIDLGYLEKGGKHTISKNI